VASPISRGTGRVENHLEWSVEYLTLLHASEAVRTDSRGSQLGTRQAPAALLDAKRPRPYQGVFLFLCEIEGIGNP
jgi:hypothetical protein